jgi:multicomponent Na+:H+ antiporter subunit B
VRYSSRGGLIGPLMSGNQDVAREDRLAYRPLVGLIVVVALATALVIGFGQLPREGAALPQIARYALQVALPDWKTTEPVNEIVYGTRGFDTFGETFLLLAAVVSVSLLSRRREPRAEEPGEAVAGLQEQRETDPASSADSAERQAREAEEAEEGKGPLGAHPGTGAEERPDIHPLGETAPEEAESMTVIVRVGARVAAAILTVIAIYLCAWGYSPGGGFPAGAALTGVVVLLYAALGYRLMRRAVSQELIEPLEMLGAMAIVLIAGLGLVLKGSFTANWLPLAPVGTIRSGGVLQAFSAAELLEVGTGLVLVIFGLLRIEHDWSPDEDITGSGDLTAGGDEAA